ncbi:MAG: dienelactone hydrolase family protein, partial [Chromatiales bacterium]|nr:dienelactone hydrolase family protein [Chromatiales bacterium]
MLKASKKLSRACIRIAVLLLAFCGAAAAQQPASQGHMVRVPTAYSTYFEGYLAGPSDARLGVVLVHDRWGLNAQVKAWADRVAALGYRVLAVDLFDGRLVRRPQDWRMVWRAIDPVWTAANMDGVLRYMRAGETPVVAIGWGKGIGPLGDLLRRSPTALAGVVLYYDNETL